MLDIQKMNDRFYAVGETILRFRWLNIAVFFILIGAAVFGLNQIRTETDVESWFLEDDQLLKVKEEFEDIFGNDEFCGVLIEADNVFSHEILNGIRELGMELKQKVPYADDVISLADLEYISGTAGGIDISQLIPEPVPTDPETLSSIREKAFSKKALKNRLVSEDGRYTWLMLRLKPMPDDWSEKGIENPELAIGRIAHEVVDQEKYAFLKPKLTGLPVIAHDKMAFFGKETPRLMGMALFVTMLTLAFFLRNVRGVIFPFVTLVGGMVIVFGFQGYMGISVDPSMIFIPIFLGIAITTSYSIHIFNFSRREFAATGRRRKSLLHAIEETGWPLLFCALTTMVALLSFWMVPMRPIRWIGLTASSLVGIIYVLVIVMLPTLLSFGKNKTPSMAIKNEMSPEHKEEEFRAADISKGHKGVDRLMLWLGERVLSRPKIVLTVFFLIVAICLTGLFRMDVSFDVRRTFGPKVPYVNRITYIADTPVGSLYSYGIAIEFPEPGMVKEPENLRKFDVLTHEVEALPLTKKVSSLLDVIKDMNQVMNDGDAKYYRIPENREMIAQQLLLYENAGGAEAERWVDYDYQRLRLMVEMTDYNSGEAMRELKFIQKRAKELFPGSHVLLIGSISQYTVMQSYVTWGQIASFLVALVIITILMSLVFGSLRLGFIGMIPNVAPALAVAGIMGFANIPLDMMTVTMMPMLLGLAVDDTIHFISHSQLGFQLTGSYQDATRRTFLVVGSAMFYTSLVLILSFSAFMISEVKVFINMAILIGAGILSALATDYFVTPVLLKQFAVFGKEKDI
ncbi:MAG: hypothetical protein CSA18_04120 [Deltaproteobacteria bacterium]|nr:MAG: hypothetical protein CSA18_04120 [Deltaproteobacteria bacterium]